MKRLVTSLVWPKFLEDVSILGGLNCVLRKCMKRHSTHSFEQLPQKVNFGSTPKRPLVAVEKNSQSFGGNKGIAQL